MGFGVVVKAQVVGLIPVRIKSAVLLSEAAEGMLQNELISIDSICLLLHKITSTLPSGGV